MKKEKLIYDWIVELPKNCSIMTNEAGEVAILYMSKQFGDIQPLLLKLEADNVEILSLPHTINKIKVTMAKQIRIEFAEFVKEMQEEV